MTWSERMKTAWKTFIKEALPLYAWSLIFLVGTVVLLIAAFIGVVFRLRLAFPQAFDRPISPGMPIPGIPPTHSISPFIGGFGSFYHNLLGGFDGRFTDSSMLVNLVISLIITVMLIIIGGWIVGSLFNTGLYNLTAKAYREKVSFGNFRFEGFNRIFGWQGILLLIKLAVFFIGFLGIISLQDSPGTQIVFMIIYFLLIFVIGLYLLPWLAVSSIYLLAHRKEGFLMALKGSWEFFQRHMGALWGYIGTVFLIEVAIQVLYKISPIVGGLSVLVASPFIAVLPIVWVLTLEDEKRNNFDPPFDTPYNTVPNPETQAFVNPPVEPTPTYNSQLNSLNLNSEEPKISLEKDESLPPSTDENP